MMKTAGEVSFYANCVDKPKVMPIKAFDHRPMGLKLLIQSHSSVSLFNISKIKNSSHLTHIQFQCTHIQDLTPK